MTGIVCLLALAHNWRAIRKGGSLFFNHELNELNELNKMIQHTKICKMDGPDNPVHLCDLDGMIPNVFVGMQMQVKGTKYKVKDMWAVVDENFCRQIIQVEEL